MRGVRERLVTEDKGEEIGKGEERVTFKSIKNIRSKKVRQVIEVWGEKDMCGRGRRDNT